MVTSQLNDTSGFGVVRSVTVAGDQAKPESVHLEITLELDDPLGGSTYPRTVVVNAAPEQCLRR